MDPSTKKPGPGTRCAGTSRTWPTATITVLFCDLVASTERQQHLGDDAADEFRRLFFATLRAAAAATHGEVVKTMGDGMMVVFRDSAVDAVACAHTDARRRRGAGRRAACVPAHRHQCGRSRDRRRRLVRHAGDRSGSTVRGRRSRPDARDRRRARARRDPRRPQFRAPRAGHVEGNRAAGRGRRRRSHARRRASRPRRGPGTTPHGRATRRRWLGATVVVAIVAASLAFVPGARTRTTRARSTARAYTPRVETTACASSVRALVPDATCGSSTCPRTARSRAGAGFACGSLAIPLATAPTDDRSIELATALDTAEIVDDPAQSPVRDEADLIVFGGRGLDSSSPALTCPEFAGFGPDLLRPPETDAGHDREGAGGVARLPRSVSCARASTLDHYTVIDEADDVRRSRAHARISVTPTCKASGTAHASRWRSRGRRPTSCARCSWSTPKFPGRASWRNRSRSLGGAFDRYVAVVRRRSPVPRRVSESSATRFATTSLGNPHIRRS